MADYRKLKPHIFKWEGGYSNHPNDAGGCTMKGVTIGTYRQYYGSKKTCEDLKKITDEQWDNIFIKGYWDKCKANEIHSQSIANLIVDWTYNSGLNGIKQTQKVLGVTPDGVIGPMTLSAINSYPDQKALFTRLWNARDSYYKSIAKGANAVFLKGWQRRLDDIKWIG